MDQFHSLDDLESGLGADMLMQDIWLTRHGQPVKRGLGTLHGELILQENRSVTCADCVK
jgi:hypothetical protein